jgi:hypothetical protein
MAVFQTFFNIGVAVGLGLLLGCVVPVVFVLKYINRNR